MEAFPKIDPLGDDAVLVTFADRISWDVGVVVRTVANRIRATRLKSVTDVVPAYTTLAVYFDSARVPFASIAASLAPIIELGGLEELKDQGLIEIPVIYDGPDLAEVAERTGLTIEAVIDRHVSRTYRAYASGFQPGFAYLGDLDASLALPRRSAPRVRVPPGSVAIAGAQTAIYPLQTPGGWHLIGSTSTVMFDANRNPPALIRPGDSVRFIRKAP